MLRQFGEIEVVFDAVSKSGMSMMRKKYMRQVGHANAQMFFHVDSAEDLAQKVNAATKVLADESYYSAIPQQGLLLSTKVSMTVSDRLRMVKMIHLHV